MVYLTFSCSGARSSLIRYLPNPAASENSSCEPCSFRKRPQRAPLGIAIWCKMSKVERSVWDPAEREMTRAGSLKPYRHVALRLN